MVLWVEDGWEGGRGGRGGGGSGGGVGGLVGGHRKIQVMKIKPFAIDFITGGGSKGIHLPIFILATADAAANRSVDSGVISGVNMSASSTPHQKQNQV